ncbi:MAG: D-arabinono-1,4-lactone oxidase [Chitinophagales bacterium]
MKQQQNFRFINWAKNVQSTVNNYFQPESEEEIIALVRQYAKIRLVGTGHSWSDICQTNEAIINLDYYNKIISIDKVNKIVKTQAGIKIWQLNQLLDKEGLALKNLGSIDRQSITGAISTGTHGSGIDFQILGSQLLEFSLIKADGSKLIINKEKDAALFNACVVNLGCMGVISEVTIQVVDAFNLHDYTTTIPFDEVIDNLDDYLAKNDHFKMWWLPPTNEIVVFLYQRTQEKVNDSRLRQFLKDEVLSVLVYRFLVFVAKLFPVLAKGINRLLTWNMKGPLDRVEKSYKVYIVPEPPLHRETEWTFDISRAKEILRAYKKFITENKYNLNFIQEIRFTKGDDFWLSACHQQSSLWLGLYCYEHENWGDMLKDYETFAQQFNGRPHWGKEFNVGKEYLQTQYPKYHDFIRLRNEMDPDKKFVNKYIERLFL